MSKSYILQAFIETPWAILPHKLEALKDIVARHINGEKLTAEEIETRIHGATRPVERRVNSVAILPLFGTIFPRGNLMTQMSGATSAESIGAKFAQLLKDPDVGAIVLDVNSPGGQIGGIEELSKQIFDARGKKPILAVANHLMASAAYWIASAADEIVVSPSGDVGSVGVFAVHEDISAALEQEGVKISLISEGRYKTEGNPYEPLSDEARDAIQARVREAYDTFVEAVARNRGVNPAVVRNGFGEGRVVGARDAVKLGMADRVETLNDTINRLLTPTADGAENYAKHSDGQEPITVAKPHLQEARARLEQVGTRINQGEPNMESTYLRGLLREHEEMLARANALVDVADKEDRDLTEAERDEFAGIIGTEETPGQIDALDAKIAGIQKERARLRAAAEQKFIDGQGAEKPDASGAKTMKKADFEKLSPSARMTFMKAGGKVED